MITTEYSHISRKELFAYKKRLELIRTDTKTNHNGWPYAWSYSGWIIDENGFLYWVCLTKSDSAMHPGIRYTISSWQYHTSVLNKELSDESIQD